MEAATDLLDAAEGRGVHRATASRGAIHPEAETPQHKLGYDTQTTLCSSSRGRAGTSKHRATAQHSTAPVGWERWAVTVGERLQRRSRSIEASALSNSERSSPAARVSGRVNAGAFNQSAKRPSRPERRDLEDIARCEKHRGEEHGVGSRLPPNDSSLCWSPTQQHA